MLGGRANHTGGFLGIGGNSGNTDRKNTLQGYSDLQNIFNFALPTAQTGAATGAATTATGTNALTSSLGYWQNLLSGNRTAMTQAVAPESNAIQATSDAQKRQLAASGTARGGGVASSNQQRDTTTGAQLDNAILQARPAAASAVADVGGKLAQVGTTETGEALQALGIGEASAAHLTDISAKARAIDNSINQQAIGDVFGAAEFVGGLFA